MKMAITAWLLAVASRVATAVSSTTPKAAAIEVFLVRAMTTLISGGTTVRKAWGRTTSRSDWVKVRPMERAASAWPTPTALMPDRTAPQKKAAWETVAAITAKTKNDSRMSCWGRTNTAKKNTTVSGVLRTTSTEVAPAARGVGRGATRRAA